MNFQSRRRFLRILSASGAATVAGIAAPTFALDRFNRIKPRIKPRIKGLSLSAYSLKPHMQWFKGKQTKGKLDMLGFLDYCAKLELDGAELTSYFFPAPLDRAYINQVKRRAHLLGLDITGGAMGNNFTHAPKSDFTKTQMKYYETWIEHFADLGANVVRVFGGNNKPKGATEDEVLANVTANLEHAVKYAEKRGVILGLENHDQLKNVDLLLKIVNTIDSPWLSVTWDSANLFPTSDPYAELAKIAPYAVNAQFKAVTHVDGKPVAADFKRLVKILRDANYGGYVALEYEEKEDPYVAIPAFLKKVREAL